MIGGFFPSVMKGVVNSGALLGPLVAIEAKRLMNNGTRKRKGGGKTENWKRNYALARNSLKQHGKPSGPNISRYAAMLRKDPAAAEAFLAEFKAREFAKEQEKAMKKTRRAPRKTAVPTAPMYPGVIPVPPPSRGAIRHVFYNNTGKVLAEEIVPHGKLSKLVVNVAGKVRNITEKIPVPDSFTIGEEIPQLNESTIAAIQREAAMTRPTTALKMGKTKRNKAPLARIPEVINQYEPEEEEYIRNVAQEAAKNIAEKEAAAAAAIRAAAAPAPEKRTRKVSNEWKALYAQAKANLAKTGKKATAPQISTLAALRKRGLSNAEFVEKFKQGAIPLAAAPLALAPVTTAAEKRTRKVSNEYKAAYGKAKANLAAAMGRNPTAPQISTLAAMRKKGLSNAEFLEKAREEATKRAAEAGIKAATARKLKLTAAAAPVVVNAVKQAEAPGLLNTVMSFVRPTAPPAEAPAAVKRQYKISDEWKGIYDKAKANLVATGKKPKAHEIATLAALRKKGESNSAFFNRYVDTPETVIDLDAPSSENEN